MGQEMNRKGGRILNCDIWRSISSRLRNPAAHSTEKRRSKWLNSTIQGRLTPKIVGILVLLLFISFSGLAGGIGAELSFYTLDLSPTISQIPTAVSDSLDALGISGAAKSTILADLDATLAQIEADFPVSSTPIPLLGGSIGISLPFIVVDELRISGGILNDSLLRGMANLFGLALPSPLFDETIDTGLGTGTITADLSFSTFMLSTELVKRLDLIIAGIELGVGVDLIQGSVVPQVDPVLPGFQPEVDAALATLHLDEFHWSVFATHVSLGIELGPPFLRLFARGQILLPLSQSSGWWPLSMGSISGSIGVVIRF